MGLRKKREERLEDEVNEKKKAKKLNKVTFMAILLCVFIFFFVKGIGLGDLTGKTKEEGTAEAEAVFVPDTTSWELHLVNKDKLLHEDFRVDLMEVAGCRVDERIAEPLLEMVKAAKKEDVVLKVVSSYRSVSEQDALYQAEIAKYVADGKKEEKAIKLAQKYVSPPGASEHHIGLAVDLNTSDMEEALTEEFGNTPAYTWLQANAATYGFVERYGKKKVRKTGVEWEPWHYRYVGVENAQKMVEEKMCLEEYIKEYQVEPEEVEEEK